MTKSYNCKICPVEYKKLSKATIDLIKTKYCKVCDNKKTVIIMKSKIGTNKKQMI